MEVDASWALSGRRQRAWRVEAAMLAGDCAYACTASVRQRALQYVCRTPLRQRVRVGLPPWRRRNDKSQPKRSTMSVLRLSLPTPCRLAHRRDPVPLVPAHCCGIPRSSRPAYLPAAVASVALLFDAIKAGYVLEALLSRPYRPRDLVAAAKRLGTGDTR